MKSPKVSSRNSCWCKHWRKSTKTTSKILKAPISRGSQNTRIRLTFCYWKLSKAADPWNLGIRLRGHSTVVTCSSFWLRANWPAIALMILSGWLGLPSRAASKNLFLGRASSHRSYLGAFWKDRTKHRWKTQGTLTRIFWPTEPTSCDSYSNRHLWTSIETLKNSNNFNLLYLCKTSNRPRTRTIRRRWSPLIRRTRSEVARENMTKIIRHSTYNTSKTIVRRSCQQTCTLWVTFWGFWRRP